MWRLKSFDDTIECVEFCKAMLEKTRAAIIDMDLPFVDLHHFFLEQMNRLPEHYDQWKQQKEETEKLVYCGPKKANKEEMKDVPPKASMVEYLITIDEINNKAKLKSKVK